ncbi:MFS transporter [Trichothermofontia sp.]
MSTLDRPVPSKWWAIAGVGLGVLMFTLDTSMVNLALPTLVTALKTSFTLVQWVVVGYLSVITALVLGAARLGDMLGKKSVYVGGLVLFTIGALLSGLAPSIEWLIGFHALQALGGVFISALSFAITTEAFPPSERGKALGIAGGILSLGLAIGPLLAGSLIELAGWRPLFLIHLPLGVLAALIIATKVPPSPHTERSQPFDLVGAILIAGMLIALSLGMTEIQELGIQHPFAWSLLLVAAIGLGLFIWWERRLAIPLVNLSLFQNRVFSLSLGFRSLVFMVVAGFAFILPFFLSLVLDYPPRHIGLLLITIPLLTAIMSVGSGILADQFGSRIMSLAGLMLMALGCLLISTQVGGGHRAKFQVIATNGDSHDRNGGMLRKDGSASG